MLSHAARPPPHANLDNATGRRACGPAPARAAPRPDARALLGLQRGATAAEARAAYLRKIRKIHPDVDPAPGATEAAAALNAAYASLLDELGGGSNGGEADAEADVFDFPETEATELFVDPFACPGASPLEWRELRAAAAAAAAAPGGDALAALRAAGAQPADGAVLYLTPAQLAAIDGELVGMAPDPMGVEIAAYMLRACLGRARSANARGPRAPRRA
jgi:hypothetical protein